jgi:hypothetical protein
LIGCADYAIFANPDFDPNDYANSILAGELYLPHSGKSTATKTSEPLAKEDISVAISKLNFGIDDVTKQIKAVVGMASCCACTLLRPTSGHDSS